MKRLEGKVCVLTGAAGDIGRAAARRFAAEGASLVLVDRDAERLDALVAGLDADRAVGVVADVAVESEVIAYMDAARQRFGGIDCVLANAGIAGPAGRTLETCPVEAFDQVLAVNVRSAWLAIKHATPMLRARGGGSVVITSSVAGVVGVPGLASYVVSKHALSGLAKVAAAELARDNVRVNTVNPAPVESPMMHEIERGLGGGAQDAVRAAVTAGIPLGRYACDDDVANMMLFLCSDEARYCTGGIYLVDGGVAAV